jgi:hypothetical protein
MAMPEVPGRDDRVVVSAHTDVGARLATATGDSHECCCRGGPDLRCVDVLGDLSSSSATFRGSDPPGTAEASGQTSPAIGLSGVPSVGGTCRSSCGCGSAIEVALCFHQLEIVVVVVEAGDASNLNRWNEEPKPFVWHKNAEEILDTLANYCERISDSGH